MKMPESHQISNKYFQLKYHVITSWRLFKPGRI